MLLIYVFTAYFSNNFSSSNPLFSYPEVILEALPVFYWEVIRFLWAFRSYWVLESYSNVSDMCWSIRPVFDPTSSLSIGPLPCSKEAVFSPPAAEFYMKICYRDLFTFMLTMLIWVPPFSFWYWSSEILSWSYETRSTLGNSYVEWSSCCCHKS